jgi:hypothetical protein
MDRREVVRSRIEALEQELAELAKFGDDVYEDGEVLIFSGSFVSGTNYHYAAIKAGGSWFLTGARNENQYLSWGNLVSFWRRANVSKIRVVTKTRRVL